MTREEKISIISEVLEMEANEIDEAQNLSDIETWDSVAVLSVIAVINEKYNRFPLADELTKLETVKDLMDFLG